MAAAASSFLRGGMLDEEPDEDLEDELEVDEVDVISRKSDTRSKGYTLFRFGTGHEGGCRSLHSEGFRRRSAC